MSSLNYRDVNLLSYLPTYLKSYKEFKVLAEAEGPEIETVFNELNIIRSNQFINSCDEEGIEKFEDLIGISVNKNDNLETRKARVLIRWVQDIPYTYETLEMQLNSLCGVDGFELFLDNDSYYLEVLVKLVSKDRFEDIKRFLNSVVPCNLTVNVFVDYNKYMIFKPFMYKEVSKFTWKELREKIIDVDDYLYKHCEYRELTNFEISELNYGNVRRKGEWF